MTKKETTAVDTGARFQRFLPFIFVRDLATAKEFYTKTLGCHEIYAVDWVTDDGKFGLVGLE